MAHRRTKDWYRVGAVDATHTIGFDYQSSCELVLAIAGQQALDQYQKGYYSAKHQGYSFEPALARAVVG